MERPIALTVIEFVSEKRDEHEKKSTWKLFVRLPDGVHRIVAMRVYWHEVSPIGWIEGPDDTILSAFCPTLVPKLVQAAFRLYFDKVATPLIVCNEDVE